MNSVINDARRTIEDASVQGDVPPIGLLGAARVFLSRFSIAPHIEGEKGLLTFFTTPTSRGARLMCIIVVKPTNSPYPGFQQVLLRRDVLVEEEDAMDSPERGQDSSSIPLEARYFLMLFLLVRDWSLACDILAEHPSLVAPWASDLLRTMVLEESFSAEDFAVYCAHIFVLDLVRAFGVEETRAFLTHRAD
jgi:hypothetical protein